ncbi:target of EGR1 protein 1-like [Patiria miniata]|uniref:Target of EGR1 protein 1 n=1 Tax=Patiria miniata TaxID=46514 RepID=A0A913Z9L5_PATMI|nr:target of EGR1 protein 1-like [Patiria miniata]
MAFFSSVPVVDVHRENFKSLWPSLILAIKSCSFVAMDAELSGLGNRKNLLTRSMEDRYQSLAGVAKTRSVLSLGISCFKVRSQPAGDQSALETKDAGLPFLAQTFNITTLCSEDYTVEPGSLKFLVDHGFDFNKQYASGVPYHRGQDKEETESEDTQTLRTLFSELIRSSKPVVFHNGLVDLVFLYQNFYAELPASFSQFISDLCEIFPGGIFDSKYLAEFEARMQASYLEYAFRRSQRTNARLASRGQQHVAVEFCKYQEDASFVGFHHCGLPSSFTDQGGAAREGAKQTAELCGIYAAHGHCKNGIRCPKSHDPDAIQDADERREQRQRRKRKRRRKRHDDSNDEGFPNAKKEKEDDDDDDDGDEDGSCHGDTERDENADAAEDLKEEESSVQAEDTTSKPVNGESSENKSSLTRQEEASPQKLPKQTGGHRAGYDAFMTGFIMATLASTTMGQHSGPSQPAKTEGGQEFVEAFRLTEFRNRLFLSAKAVPLLIAKSKFAKTSQNHRQKMKRLGMTAS